MSDSTAPVMTAGTFARWDEVDTRPQRISTILPRNRLEELKLKQRLAAFDGARTANERLDAQEQVLSLGSEAIPSVLAELSLSQPPDRADVLLELLVKRESPDRVIELACQEGGSWALRASLAEALARCASTALRSEPALRRRIGAALVTLARDSDIGVRSTAIDAIGLAGIADEPEIHTFLEDVAENDRDAGVQAEARAILDEST